MKKVLFVITSHDELGDTGRKTGVWIEEFAAPYYYLADAGVQVSIASPKGGRPPIDPMSEEPGYQTEHTRRFYHDDKMQEMFSNTLRLEDIDQDDYDAIFYPGGHGPMWDLSEDRDSIALIEGFYSHDKPVTAVCHGPAAFKNVKNPDGTPLITGKKVSGWSNTEEAAVNATDIVPFSLENMLKENGGIYSKTEDWGAYVVVDGQLITGQNPASSVLVAEKLLEKINL